MPAPTLGYSKRLRAHLCLLVADEQGHDVSLALPAAVTVELLHNATLIVDDIQDSDTERCGRPALWTKTSVAEAMNAAFFLACTAQAYYLAKVSHHGLPNLSADISSALNSLLSGQQLDVSYNRFKRPTISHYETMVDGKTGALILLSCLLGTCIRESDPIREHWRSFALAFARLHQIQDDVDDLLALRPDAEEMISIPNASIAAYCPSVSPPSIKIADLPLVLAFTQRYSEEQESRLHTSLTLLRRHRILRSDRLSELVFALSARNSKHMEVLIRND